MIKVKAAAHALETPRLQLRPHRIADLDEMVKLWQAPEVVRYTSGKPSTREETWARVLRHAGHWSLLGFGPWVVQRRDDGAFVGEVGFFFYKREIEPRIDDAPEAGWVLAPAAHGRGYATEAVRAALAWADANVDAPATCCIIAPENTASVAVAAKCGFREKARGTYRDAPTLVFERPRGG